MPHPTSIHILTLIFTISHLSLTPIHSHSSQIIQIPQTQIAHGLTNRMIPIDISKTSTLIHTAKTSTPDDKKYLVVHPATVYPNHMYLQQHLILPTQSPTLLQQLRTYKTARYKSIIIFQGYIFLHALPNKIVIVRQKQRNQGFLDTLTHTTTFQIQNSYILDDITIKNQTRMYKIKNNKQISVLLVVKNSKIVYKLGLKQSYKYQMKQIFEVGHLQFIADNTFIVAQNMLGIGFYKIQNNRIYLIKRYTCQDIGIITGKSNKQKQKQLKDRQKQGPTFQLGPDSILKQQLQIQIQDIQSQIPQPQRRKKYTCYITDLSYNPSTSSLYILDAISGLTQYDLTFNSSTLVFDKLQSQLAISRPTQILNIKDCDALDFVTSQHFIIICQVDMPNSYIQQIIKLDDPLIAGKKVWIKKEPIYHKCNFKDLIVTQDFYLAFDSYTIDVFWNTIKSGSSNQYSTQHTKQHFNLPGLEVFGLKIVPYKNNTNIPPYNIQGPSTTNISNNKMYFYAVQSNVLFKYQLMIFNGAVYVYSPIPISKQIKIQIPSKCDPKVQPLLTLNKQFNKNLQCIYEYKIQLQIQEKIEQVSQEKISMSIGVIIIMLVVILILTWICLVKYRGLQEHARKILDKYRQKNSNYNQNKFTI